MSHMVMIKCFETADMPEWVYNGIKDSLSRGEEGDTATFFIMEEDDLNDMFIASDAIDLHKRKEWLDLQFWFINNGAEHGEAVILRRGTEDE